MSIYAIGDIHGTVKSLKLIFDNINFNKDDKFVFLGDYIDRGKNSKETIDYILRLEKTKKCYFLKGNHEILMSAAKKNMTNLIKWLHYGGNTTLDSYSIGDEPEWANKIPKKHWNFIENGLPYLETDNFIFVHAGLKPFVDLDKQTEENLYWNRVENPEKYSENKTVICGHTARLNGQIADFGHTICIDTFAHGGKWLTCLNAETREFIQTNEKGEIKNGKTEPQK